MEILLPTRSSRVSCRLLVHFDLLFCMTFLPSSFSLEGYYRYFCLLAEVQISIHSYHGWCNCSIGDTWLPACHLAVLNPSCSSNSAKLLGNHILKVSGCGRFLWYSYFRRHLPSTECSTRIVEDGNGEGTCFYGKVMADFWSYLNYDKMSSIMRCQWSSASGY